jgi:hypothetical protein
MLGEHENFKAERDQQILVLDGSFDCSKEEE